MKYAVKVVDEYFKGYHGLTPTFCSTLDTACIVSPYDAKQIAADLRCKGINAYDVEVEEKELAKTEAPAFVKADDGKVRADLLPAEALLQVAEVLTLGAAKYGADNWRKVDDVSRYKAALMRHVLQYLSGQAVDAESGKSHLAHVACNALFLLELDREK